MGKQSILFLVDDDENIRDSLNAHLVSAGYLVHSYDSAEAFLANADAGTGDCLISDIRMAGMSGLELQAELRSRDEAIPIIFITGHGDIAMAVQALQSGASDFIEKPFTGEVLLASVARAVSESGAARSSAHAAAGAATALSLLTARERAVFDQIVLGQSNKVTAKALGISPRTVENHRAEVMRKLGTRSLSDLVRLSIAVGLAG